MTNLNQLWGKSTLWRPNIVVTNIAFLHLVFLCKYRHDILDYFYLFEEYWINILDSFKKKKNSFFSAIKTKYYMHLKKKPIPNERERDFIVGHYIIFSDFFCLVMSYEPQT
jgi:hypothetical protein